jgi:hypothetical protein
VPGGRDLYDTVISALLYAGRLPVAVAIVVARSRPLVAKVAQAWSRWRATLGFRARRAPKIMTDGGTRGTRPSLQAPSHKTPA